VGLNDFNPNSTGAVAVYQDGVAINAPALQLGTLFDMEAVNIERGPQGTGLGRNASAGAIKLYSRKPSGEFGAYMRSDFGNYDYQDYEGALEAPLFEDMLAGRFAFRLSKRDGTMKNRCAGAPLVDNGISFCGEPIPRRPEFSPIGLAKYVNNTDNWAARGTLRFEPNLDMTWLVNAHGSRRDELSRLGQSIGTGGTFCRDGRICQPTPGDRRANPPLVDSNGRPLVDPTARSSGLLGAPANTEPPNASNYWPREIEQRLIELAPCFANGGDCRIGPNFQFLPLEERLAGNEAKIQLANELAKNLDSEPWEGDFNRTGPTQSDNYGVFVKGEISLPWDIQLTTTNAYDSYDRFASVDLDFSPVELFEIDTDDDAWQYYGDLNLAGEAFSDSLPVYLEFGGWFLREELGATVTNHLGAASAFGVRSREYTQQLWSSALYGAFSFDFWDDFTLDGGVRYNWENKNLDMLIDPDVPVAPGEVGGTRATDCVQSPNHPRRFRCDETWHAPTGTLRLTYRFNTDTDVYWKYTRGWKSGSANATASQLNGPSVADPEKIDSFETGVHGAWFDGSLGLDTSLFYYAYSDYQIFTAKQFLGGTPEFVILNANDAEVYGAEVDGVVRPWEGAFVNLRFSWLESQFLDFVTTDQFLAETGGTSDLVIFRDSQNSGNPLLNSPKFKISLTAEQSVELGRYGSVSLRYDATWSDITYYDATKGVGLGDVDGNKFLPSETIAQEPYWLHGLRLSWRSSDERFELALWVRNLANHAYKTFAFDASTFRQTTIYFVGDPRTFGGSIGVTF
jgi:outer membrane receptor protein involved in Fe transport